MKQCQVPVYEIIVIGREPDNAPDLPEGALGVIVHLDIVVAQGHCGPAEVSPEVKENLISTFLVCDHYRPVLKVNTVGRSHHPLVCDQGASTEMTFVYPHRNLKVKGFKS